MRWYWWTALGLGGLYFFTRKPATVVLSTTGLTTGAAAQTALTETIYLQLIQAVQNKLGTSVNNVSMTQEENGELTFTGQILAADGKSYITTTLNKPGQFPSADAVVAWAKA
jgi:hypothetical protein